MEGGRDRRNEEVLSQLRGIYNSDREMRGRRNTGEKGGEKRRNEKG